MDIPDVSLTEAATLAAFLLFGVAGTIIAALAALTALQSVQPVVYDSFYLRLGPWSATTAATIVHFGLAGALAVGVPVVVAELVDGDRVRLVGAGLVVVTVALLLFLLGAAALDAQGLLIVLLVYVLLVVGSLAGLRHVGASTGASATFVGGVPVLALLLVVLAFGLGWGGGYDVVAEPVSASSVDEPATTFEDAPDVREDLFSEDACDPEDGVCRLPLRGYEHEAQAARVLDSNGVRCPLVNAPASERWDRDASVVAEHDGQYYRIYCQAYGD
jgi:hypothetical protein